MGNKIEEGLSKNKVPVNKLDPEDLDQPVRYAGYSAPAPGYYDSSIDNPPKKPKKIVQSKPAQFWTSKDDFDWRVVEKPSINIPGIFYDGKELKKASEVPPTVINKVYYETSRKSPNSGEIETASIRVRSIDKDGSEIIFRA